jgi:hypothetical protein
MGKQRHESDEEFTTRNQTNRIWYPFFKGLGSIVESLNEFKHRARYDGEGKAGKVS